MMNSAFVQPVQPQPEFRQCFNCNFEAVTVNTICPRCKKKKFFTSDSIRVRGVVLLIVGLFLVVFMGGIAAFVAILLLGATNDPGSARKINDEIGALIGIYALFAAVIAFGLNSILGGLWMLIAGRRNRFLVWVMWALFVAMFVGGNALRFFLD